MQLMKILYLHIGHGKTGTSYLQSLFAVNQTMLQSKGFLYPDDPSNIDAAAGKITSGNGMQLQSLLNNYRHQTKPATIPLAGIISGRESVIFSSEWLFRFLIDATKNDTGPVPWGTAWNGTSADQRIACLLSWAQSQGFEQVKILLLIRNPMGHANSDYQQSVKRHGLTTDISQTFHCFSAPFKVQACLDNLSKYQNIDITVRNYSVVQHHLDETVAEWLEVTPVDLTLPPVRTINRSLTLGECEFLRFLNHELGRDASFVADALCNQLPDVDSEKTPVAPAVQDALWQNLQPAIQAVNARIDHVHHYQFDRIIGADVSDEFRFKSSQIKVITHSVGHMLKNLHAELTSSALRKQHDQLKIQKLQDKLTIKEAERQKLRAKVSAQKNKISQLKTLSSKKTRVFSREAWGRRLRRWLNKIPRPS